MLNPNFELNIKNIKSVTGDPTGDAFLHTSP